MSCLTTQVRSLNERERSTKMKPSITQEDLRGLEEVVAVLERDPDYGRMVEREKMKTEAARRIREAYGFRTRE